ncbi:peptidase inhibitor family I36 protein [Arthrobacter sp. NPDC058130]|uniref:peptidase inhibitor family I36 protein n=1 Tax=Arthrobacter sp. NPDC058130 TaxID=3346353 RepID=UPI0036E67201
MIGAVRKTAATLGVGVMVTIGGIAGAAPAHAALSNCPANNVCNWQDANYTGSWAWFNTYSRYSYVYPYNDGTSSIANRRSATAVWYSESGYWGSSWTLDPGQDVSLYVWPYNDVFSSHYLY